jgi:cytochrome c551/c552
MKKAIMSFVISAVLGFGLGYVVYHVINGTSKTEPQTAAKTETSTPAADTKETASAPAATAVDQDNILSKRGCLGCHSVGSLNLKGGQVGPDLSQAFKEVADKHGMPIEQFLTKPNSAVMSGVLGSKPLTDDERKQVIDLLKKASEAK